MTHTLRKYDGISLESFSVQKHSDYKYAHDYSGRIYQGTILIIICYYINNNNKMLTLFILQNLAKGQNCCRCGQLNINNYNI